VITSREVCLHKLSIHRGHLEALLKVLQHPYQEIAMVRVLNSLFSCANVLCFLLMQMEEGLGVRAGSSPSDPSPVPGLVPSGNDP